MPADPQPTETQDAIDWHGLLQTLYYRVQLVAKQLWWVPVLIVPLLAILYAYQSASKPVVYESRARMHVGPQVAIPEGRLYSEELTSFYGTQLEFMRSNRVREGAQLRVRALLPNLQAVPVKFTAFRRSDTSLFELAAEGSNSEYVRAYLNAVMDEYMRFRSEMRAQTAQDTYSKISGELERLGAEINQREDAIVDYQRENNIVFLREQVELASRFITALTQERAEAAAALRTLESVPLDQQLATGTAFSARTPAAEELGGQLAAFRSTSAELDKLRVERDAYAVHLRPAHPKMLQYAQEEERLLQILALMRVQVEGRLKLRAEALAGRIANIDVEMGEWEARSLEFNRRLAAFRKLESELNLTQRNYERLSQSLESIDLNQNIQQDTVNVLERASVSVERRADLRRDTLKGAMVGAALSVALMALFGFLDNRIFNAEDLTRHFDIDLLGVVPREKVKRSERLSLLHEDLARPVFVEALRNLRSSLLFLDHSGGVMRPQVFMITSSVPNEGKSTIASNIAIALAMAHSKVLLIDADLRLGELAKDFGGKKVPGLTECALGIKKLADVVQHTHVQDLDLIPTGARSESPGELFLKTRMGSLIEEARREYQYIIIDTAPILAADDAIGLVPKVDSVLFVVRSGQTQLRQMRPAVEKLLQRRAKIAGFVLNDLDSKQPSYQYYKYYDYYSGG